MTSIRGRILRLPLALCLLGSVSWPGCGGAPSDPAAPTIQEGEKSQITSALPSGVTFESPIKPDPMLGPNSKTVGDALAALQAHVKDGKIYDGALGRQILFEVNGKKPVKPKSTKKGAEEFTTIVVTGG